MTRGGAVRVGLGIAIVSAVLAGILTTTLALPGGVAPVPLPSGDPATAAGTGGVAGGTGTVAPGPMIKPGLMCGPSRDLTGAERSRDAQFVRWYYLDWVIHVSGGAFEGAGTANVSAGHPILIGFEWAADPGQNVSDLDALYRGNPDHGIRAVLNGTPLQGDWKQYYQPAFFARTQCGPDWSWDHDGDGPGDGNGNGVGDFAGPVLFWRAPLGPLGSGTYVLSVEVTMDGGATWGSIPGGTIVVR